MCPLAGFWCGSSLQRQKEPDVSAELLDGKKLAGQIQQEIALQVGEWTRRTSIIPTLAAVLVGENPASRVYVRNKRQACERVGMTSRLVELPATVAESELLAQIEELNDDPTVHGILVQLPLPATIDSTRVLDAVNPLKDVDAFHPDNVGRLVQGRPRFLPCTPHGVQQMLHRHQIPVAGRHVVIVGRSEIVGKPLALMLMQRDSPLGPSAVNATVTVCHSRSQNLSDITRAADVLVAAVGQPRLITAEMVQPGAVVIDVGINRVDNKLVGDVDFATVSRVARHITPVPGGVGPMTIAMLLQNTLAAAKGLSSN
jgi:methylenetetrahydrofolate dehydrogenase (NADP+)/methenyltetrahydrofolate cyclohydrolase